MKTSAVLTCAALAGLALTALTVADEKPAAKSGAAAAFEGLKKLVGEWCQADKEGKDGKHTHDGSSRESVILLG